MSFEDLDKWLTELKEHADPYCCIMIVGNKSDLRHLRAVETEDGRILAGNLDHLIIEPRHVFSNNVARDQN